MLSNPPPILNQVSSLTFKQKSNFVMPNFVIFSATKKVDQKSKTSKKPAPAQEINPKTSNNKQVLGVNENSEIQKPFIDIETQINLRLKELSKALKLIQTQIVEPQTESSKVDGVKILFPNQNQPKSNTSNFTLIQEKITKNTDVKTYLDLTKIDNLNKFTITKSQSNYLNQLFSSKILDLEITSGKYKGAFLSGPNGYINWYFDNLTLVHLIDKEPQKVKTYLNLYLDNLESDYTIKDINWDLETKLEPDSHDSYAATFLQLASRYTQKTGDYEWFKNNLPKLKLIAQNNLINQQKSNNLVYTFQNGTPFDISYLMDNCEVYAGVTKFSNVLREINDSESEKYRVFANRVADGIFNNLYDSKNQNWLVSDQSGSTVAIFYPDLTSQIFPELYGIPNRDSKTRYDKAADFFESNTPNWNKMEDDIFPWTVIAYYNISSNRDPSKSLQMILDFSVNINDPEKRYSVIDLAWALGATNLLTIKN